MRVSHIRISRLRSTATCRGNPQAWIGGHAIQLACLRDLRLARRLRHWIVRNDAAQQEPKQSDTYDDFQRNEGSGNTTERNNVPVTDGGQSCCAEVEGIRKRGDVS